MRYISIDPATKSIATAVIDVPTPANVSDLSTLKVVFTDTSNLIGIRANTDVGELERVQLIWQHLETKVLPYVNKDLPTTALIEKQISGTKTYIIYVTLCSFFISKGVPVELIAPTKKNTLRLGGEKPDYRQYHDSYIANKEHSRKMFIDHIKPLIGGTGHIKYDKKNERDIADCFTQLVAFLSP